MMNITDTIKILKRLRKVQTEYPAEMFMSRKNEFFSQIAAIRVELKADIQSQSAQSSISKDSLHVVEQALRIVVIVASIIVSALGLYTYRENIRDVFSPEAVEVQSVDVESPAPELTLTATPTLTPTLTLMPMQSPTKTDNSSFETPGTSTPVPEETNAGLHLGQTKTPKPTKEK